MRGLPGQTVYCPAYYELGSLCLLETRPAWPQAGESERMAIVRTGAGAYVRLPAAMLATERPPTKRRGV